MSGFSSLATSLAPAANELEAATPDVGLTNTPSYCATAAKVGIVPRLTHSFVAQRRTEFLGSCRSGNVQLRPVESPIAVILCHLEDGFGCVGPARFSR